MSTPTADSLLRSLEGYELYRFKFSVGLHARNVAKVEAAMKEAVQDAAKKVVGLRWIIDDTAPARIATDPGHVLCEDGAVRKVVSKRTTSDWGDDIADGRVICTFVIEPAREGKQV